MPTTESNENPMKFFIILTYLFLAVVAHAQVSTRQVAISWLHRCPLERGREFVLPNEPKVPDFVLKASGFESE